MGIILLSSNDSFSTGRITGPNYIVTAEEIIFYLSSKCDAIKRLCTVKQRPETYFYWVLTSCIQKQSLTSIIRFTFSESDFTESKTYSAGSVVWFPKWVQKHELLVWISLPSIIRHISRIFFVIKQNGYYNWNTTKLIRQIHKTDS